MTDGSDAANVKQDFCSLQIKEARGKYQQMRTNESSKIRKRTKTCLNDIFFLSFRT